ncbi:hypothetical protein PMAYCL1PPCAC_01948, partial [Pristionchus mayeri]
AMLPLRHAPSVLCIIFSFRLHIENLFLSSFLYRTCYLFTCYLQENFLQCTISCGSSLAKLVIPGSYFVYDRKWSPEGAVSLYSAVLPFAAFCMGLSYVTRSIHFIFVWMVVIMLDCWLLFGSLSLQQMHDFVQDREPPSVNQAVIMIGLFIVLVLIQVTTAFVYSLYNWYSPNVHVIFSVILSNIFLLMIRTIDRLKYKLESTGCTTVSYPFLVFALLSFGGTILSDPTLQPYLDHFAISIRMHSAISYTGCVFFALFVYFRVMAYGFNVIQERKRMRIVAQRRLAQRRQLPAFNREYPGVVDAA